MLEHESIYDTKTPITPATVKISFDDFYAKSIAKAKEQAKNVKYVQIEITGVDSILNYNIDDIEDQELVKIISLYYKDFLNNLMVMNDARYIVLFQNNKFLMCLNQVLSQQSALDISDINHLNKLAYDYSVLVDHDSYTMNLWYTIARTINRTTISKLLGLGLPDIISTELAICRYSNQDEVICTKRLNNKLIRLNRNMITEQMLVDIYCTLYTSMTPLFIGTMYDIYTQEELAAFGPDADIINSTINIAVMDILDTMTSPDIRKVLITYAETYGLNNNFCSVRFDISACPDYQRVLTVCQYLSEQENIQLP